MLSRNLLKVSALIAIFSSSAIGCKPNKREPSPNLESAALAGGVVGGDDKVVGTSDAQSPATANPVVLNGNGSAVSTASGPGGTNEMRQAESPTVAASQAKQAPATDESADIQGQAALPFAKCADVAEGCDYEPVLEVEAIGPFRPGAPAKVVLAELGAPEQKGQIGLSQIDGSYTQNWSFPQKGIELQMVSDSRKGAQTVGAIRTKRPCTYKTKAGIGIGSTVEELRKAYRGYLFEETKEGRRMMEELGDAVASGEGYTIGNDYYGIYFSFAAGKVEEIIWDTFAD